MMKIVDIHKSKTEFNKISDKWASYLDYYDLAFLNIQKKNDLKLLEIGVQNGGSLETWASYFTNGSIFVGCDINTKCSDLVFSDSRIKIVVGDANDISTYSKIKEFSGNFDVVIDDGSHISGDIISSFELYFPLLNPGGIYVIEDTHTLYWHDWGGGILNEKSAYNFFKKLIDVVSFQHWRGDLSNLNVYFRTFYEFGKLPSFINDGWIESIEFKNSIISIKKSVTATHDKLGERLIKGLVKTV
jgi:hypothetical protein